jgi:dipeptidyl aminopeptidase/acylaminoacyl peptidase
MINPGESTPAVFSGHAGEEFGIGGRRAFVIRPPRLRPGQPPPWVWYAPTLPGLPGPEENWMFRRFLDAGLAIAGIDVGESYGSPAGRGHFSTLYQDLTQQRGFSSRPGLLARSRGGLMLYNWAVEHPHAVACIAGIYPVCNLASYPGLTTACGAYGLTEPELAGRLAEHNPLDRCAPLAAAGVPILHLHGDEDAIVPLAANSVALAERYQQQGGPMRVIVAQGRGHDRWSGWFESQELVDFVITHAAPGPTGARGP